MWSQVPGVPRACSFDFSWSLINRTRSAMVFTFPFLQDKSVSTSFTPEGPDRTRPQKPTSVGSIENLSFRDLIPETTQRTSCRMPCYSSLFNISTRKRHWDVLTSSRTCSVWIISQTSGGEFIQSNQADVRRTIQQRARGSWGSCWRCALPETVGWTRSSWQSSPSETGHGSDSRCPGKPPSGSPLSRLKRAEGGRGITRLMFLLTKLHLYFLGLRGMLVCVPTCTRVWIVYSLYRPKFLEKDWATKSSKPSETKKRMAQASLSRLPEAKPW